MKTLLYTIDYPPNRGGVARYLHGLADYFRDEIDVVVPTENQRRWWNIATDLFRRQETYDHVLVSHVLPVGTGAFIAKMLTGKAYIVIVHGMDIGIVRQSWWKKILAGIVLRHAKLVIANSQALEREVQTVFEIDTTLVIYPPVISRSPQAVRLLRSARNDNTVNLLTVARLVPRKGHLRVLDALDLLQKSHPELTIHYTIVGDGPMRESIQKRVSDLGLGSVQIVTDATDDDLPSHYTNTDIFAMPIISDPVDREGFGMVYLEAASYGVPSIATNMPGVDEAVLDGETGLLIPDGNIQRLAEAIYELATDPKRRLRLGNAAKSRVESLFTPESQFSKLAQVIAKSPQTTRQSSGERISVIIPSYQHAATIEACLKSIFAQTRQPNEIIVVNDGSTDGTDTILTPYRNRITIIQQENQGGNAARNNGFNASRGDLVIFCDADVIMRQDMLEKMEDVLLENPNTDFSYSGFRFGWKSFRSFSFNADRLRQFNYIHTTSLIRRNVFPGFDPMIRRFQDWDVWLSMIGRGSVGVHIDEQLFWITDDASRPGISQWRPSFLFQIPWHRLPWKPKSVEKYQAAKKIIAEKHRL